jgi:hypothetical protein
MNTSNTYNLTENQLVDTYGFFTLREEHLFFYDVPKEMHSGKLSKFRGAQIKLELIATKRYGNILSITATNKKSAARTRKIDLQKFEAEQKRFSKLLFWNQTKRQEGIKFFNYLRAYNPLYIQKPKDWIKEDREGSRVGDYVVRKVRSKNGVLKPLDGFNCLFVVTYNKGYNNGFLVIPILEN